MNTPNNKRRKLSQEKIEKTFVELIQTKEISEISVSDICKKANLNRTTFYSNYIDIYDLVDKINEKMFNDFFNIYTKEREEKKHSYDLGYYFYLDFCTVSLQSQKTWKVKKNFFRKILNKIVKAQLRRNSGPHKKLLKDCICLKTDRIDRICIKWQNGSHSL